MDTSDTCEVCRSSLFRPNREWSDCVPCETAARKFAQSSRLSADADYAYHELAHHVMLFGRLPHKKADWDRVTSVVGAFSQGQSQLHELRVLALQYASYSLLGWRPTIERLVELSWDGISEVDDYSDKGEKVVHTPAAAQRLVAALVVSPRKIRLYSNAVQRLRGET